MGVAGIGPAYSLAATAAVLIGSVGVLAPASLLYCGLIMFGIVFAFRHLNHQDANAGASYSWLASIFSPAIGFFACWSVLTGSALFMVSGTLPAAAATLKLLKPGMVDNQNAYRPPIERQGFCRWQRVRWRRAARWRAARTAGGRASHSWLRYCNVRFSPGRISQWADRMAARLAAR